LARNDTSWAFDPSKLGKTIYEYFDDAKNIDDTVFEFYKSNVKYFSNFTMGFGLIDSD